MSVDQRERRARELAQRMREASGQVDDPRPLVAFFYVLMRDRITPGELEHLVDKALGNQPKTCGFCNGWLARHAQDVVDRLLEVPLGDPEEPCGYCCHTRAWHDDAGRCRAPDPDETGGFCPDECQGFLEVEP